MKSSLASIVSKVWGVEKIGVLTFTALAILPAFVARAADIQWQGGTASYTNEADWVGGQVPGPADNAINDNGTNNVVQINVGNPDWAVNSIRAGNGAGNGAFAQNGQTVTLTGTNLNGSVVTVYSTPFRLGVATNDTGVYTLNGGAINYSSGSFDVGELGSGILNLNGGTISGSGNFADNLGVLGTPTAVTATVGDGLDEGDFTWFEQGYDTAQPTYGLPAPGTTITSESQTNHSYTFAPSYTANDSVLVSSNLLNATITLTAPTTCSGLSFMGCAGHGPTVVNYTVHHADGTTETGSFSLPDWFGPGTAQEVLAVGCRVDALGVNFQFPTPANGFTGNAPYLWSLDVPVTNTTSAVTSINLTYSSGGTACLMALSHQATSGGAFTPLAISGYNQDVVVEVGAQSYVSSSITDIVNQSAGAINITNGGQLFVGNYGSGIYNLSGGTIDVHNYIAFGRSGGSGTVNMTGGVLNQDGGGNLLVGTGYQAPANGSATGVLNQNGGTINCQGQFLVPESSPSTGTYNLSGTGALVVNNWLAIGRNAGNGVLNMDGGSITKGGDNSSHLDIGASATGILNQTNGVITNVVSDTWLGESGTGTWNLYGGSAILGNLIMCVNADATATLNLNGGLLQVNGINSSSIGVSMINFNGGTLRAGTDNANFISGIAAALLGPGGVVIDSQGYNITIPQEMDDNGGGGLTKTGTGTLTLTGPNTYTGPTTVSNGTLDVDTTSFANGNYVVTDGTTFGVSVQSANGQLNMGNFTVGSSTGAALDFDLGNFGNPSSAPMNVSGTFSAAGTITINVADAAAQIGQFPLIQYASLSGTPTFVLGTVPSGVTATLVNDTANNSVDLDITAANEPEWQGLAGGNWDIGLTTNWINLGTGLPTTYANGTAVVFNDSAPGTTTVDVTTAVSPGNITMDNSSLNYAFVGTGSIGGSFGLNKQGSASLSILNTGGNSYTGPTTISGGTLTVTNLANGGSPSPIGASPASPNNLVIGNGAFTYAGAPVASDRGFTVASTNSTIDAEGNLTLGGNVAVIGGDAAFTKVGPGTLTLTAPGDNQFASGFKITPNNGGAGTQVIAGTLELDGSAGGQTNHTTHDMYVGDTPNSGASLVLTNTTLNVDGWLAVGRVNGGVNNVSSAILDNSTMTVGNLSLGWDGAVPGGGGNLATQLLTLNGSSTLTDLGAVNLCEGNGSTLTMNINGSSVFHVQNPLYIALVTNSTSTVVVDNLGQIIQSSGWFDIAEGANSVGTLIVKDNAHVSLDSDFNVTDTGVGATAAAVLEGNATLNANNLWVGKQNGVIATFTITNNATVVSSNGLTMATYYNGSPVIPRAAVLNLSGGSLAVNLVQGSTTSGTNYGTFNFNGGTLIARNPIAVNFMFNLAAINVLADGASIDSGTNTIQITQPLLAGDAGGGGLTKLGTGTLRLNGANTYTGTTLVSAGTLGGTGSLDGGVTVASGATLTAGSGAIGTLTINSSLTFSAGSTGFMKVGAASNDQIAGLTGVSYNGALVVTNTSGTNLVAGSTYKLFNCATAGTGNFTSVTILPSGTGIFDPTNGVLTINATATINPPVVSGGNLILTGNGGAAAGSSYSVLTTTNVALPLADWTTNTAGTLNSAGMFSNSIPINAAEPARFFRVKVP